LSALASWNEQERAADRWASWGALALAAGAIVAFVFL